jgi:hypothetical protein
MANPRKRVPKNVDGDFFVDSTCIDCDACRLTHRDDVADAERYAEHLETRRIIHRDELSSQPGAEVVVDGDGPWELAPGFHVMVTPRREPAPPTWCHYRRMQRLVQRRLADHHRCPWNLQTVQIPPDSLVMRSVNTEGLADRRRRQPVANRPTREGLQVRPLSLPLQSTRSCSWESSRSPKPAEWVRLLPALLAMRCPVTQRVWRPVCRTGEMGSSPIQGAVRSGRGLGGEAAV